MRFRVLAVAFFLTAITFMAPHSNAITDEEIFRQMRFNFINPGARAMGLGGAFVAVADDSTAAEANPAGLIQLVAPEVFFEVRSLGGHQAGGEPFVENLDVLTYEFSSYNERERVTLPSFLSFVKPFRNVAIGFSYQQVLHNEVETNTKILLTDYNFPVSATLEGEGSLDIQVEQLNAAIAWRPHRIVALGATASIGNLDIDGGVTYTHQGDFFPFQSSEFPQLLYRTDIDDSDSGVTFAAGLLLYPLEELTVGLVYRGGVDYHFEEVFTRGVSIEPPGPDRLSDIPEGPQPETLQMPDRYGVGLKWKPSSRWTLAADAVRIEYSDLLTDFHPYINIITSFMPHDPTPYQLDDVTEFHLGAEYRSQARGVPWSLRLGAYTDPDNVIRSEGELETLPFDFSVVEFFSGREDEIHFTAGFGVLIQNNSQIDLGLSFSDLGNEGLISFIHRF